MEEEEDGITLIIMGVEKDRVFSTMKRASSAMADTNDNRSDTIVVFCRRSPRPVPFSSNFFSSTLPDQLYQRLGWL
jgi:hypothetical protein